MAQLRKVGAKIRLRCGARRPGNLDVIFDNIVIGPKMQVPRYSWRHFSKNAWILSFAGGCTTPKKG